jgi:hypothetical protein
MMAIERSACEGKGIGGGDGGVDDRERVGVECGETVCQ